MDDVKVCCSLTNHRRLDLLLTLVALTRSFASDSLSIFEMADTSPRDSPTEQDSLFGSSRRTSAQTDGPAVADLTQNVTFNSTEPLLTVFVKEDDREPTEDELKRNRDRFEVELEVSDLFASLLFHRC